MRLIRKKIIAEQHAMLLAAVTGMLAITVACLLEWWFPVLELFAHFSLQYVLLCAVFALWARRAGFRYRAWIFTGCFFVHAAELVFVGLVLGGSATDTMPQKTLRILQANMMVGNREPEAAMQVLLEAGSTHNVLVLMEYPIGFSSTEEARFKEVFPFHYSGRSRRDTGFNTAIYSKTPISVEEVEGQGFRSEYLKITLLNGQLRIITLHSMVPSGVAATRSRHRQHEAVFKAIAEERAAFVIGDFNQTPYATAFQVALLKHAVHLAALPDSVLPSWPHRWWASPLRIPIDNIVVNQYASVVERELVPMPGSDHYAVSNTLAIH